MPRFFLPGASGPELVLTGEDARHISRSLRSRPGEQFTVCDGAGTDFLCEVTEITSEAVYLKVLEQTESRSEPPVEITLYQALPKSDKLELIVQKAVELGVSAVVPVLTERCISRPDGKSMEKKLERLRRIAQEAAQQSGRGRIPEIRPLMEYAGALDDMKRAEQGILFYERADFPLGRALEGRPRTIAVLIGSEGGFSEREAEQAQKAGLAVCTMGPRILRCETAPMYALSAICYEYENR